MRPKVHLMFCLGNLNSEQIFFCSACCERASLLMHITWSETPQDQRKTILCFSAFTPCKLITSAKSCVYWVLFDNIYHFIVHPVLQGAAPLILSTEVCTPVDSKARASLFVALDQDQILCLQVEHNYLKRSPALSVVRVMSVGSGEGTWFCFQVWEVNMYVTVLRACWTRLKKK